MATQRKPTTLRRRHNSSDQGEPTTNQESDIRHFKIVKARA